MSTSEHAIRYGVVKPTSDIDIHLIEVDTKSADTKRDIFLNDRVYFVSSYRDTIGRKIWSSGTARSLKFDENEDTIVVEPDEHSMTRFEQMKRADVFLTPAPEENRDGLPLRIVTDRVDEVAHQVSMTERHVPDVRIFDRETMQSKYNRSKSRTTTAHASSRHRTVSRRRLQDVSVFDCIRSVVRHFRAKSQQTQIVLLTSLVENYWQATRATTPETLRRLFDEALREHENSKNILVLPYDVELFKSEHGGLANAFPMLYKCETVMTEIAKYVNSTYENVRMLNVQTRQSCFASTLAVSRFVGVENVRARQVDQKSVVVRMQLPPHTKIIEGAIEGEGTSKFESSETDGIVSFTVKRGTSASLLIATPPIDAVRFLVDTEHVTHETRKVPTALRVEPRFVRMLNLLRDEDSEDAAVAVALFAHYMRYHNEKKRSAKGQGEDVVNDDAPVEPILKLFVRNLMLRVERKIEDVKSKLVDINRLSLPRTALDRNRSVSTHEGGALLCARSSGAY